MVLKFPVASFLVAFMAISSSKLSPLANSPVTFMAISFSKLSLPVNFLPNFQNFFLTIFHASFNSVTFPATSGKLLTIFFDILQVPLNFFREVIPHYLLCDLFHNFSVCVNLQLPPHFMCCVNSRCVDMCLVYLILFLHLLSNSLILFGSCRLHFSIYTKIWYVISLQDLMCF